MIVQYIDVVIWPLAFVISVVLLLKYLRECDLSKEHVKELNSRINVLEKNHKREIESLNKSISEMTDEITKLKMGQGFNGS